MTITILITTPHEIPNKTYEILQKAEIKNPKRRIKEAKKEICQREQAQKLRSFEKNNTMN